MAKANLVTVRNKDGNKRTFTVEVWNKLPVSTKDGSRYGWKQVSEVPDEVKELHEKNTKGSPPAESKTKKITAPAAAAEKTTFKNVKEVIKLINQAKSAAAIDKLIEGDTRASVLKQAEFKKAQFS